MSSGLFGNAIPDPRKEYVHLKVNAFMADVEV